MKSAELTLYSLALRMAGSYRNIVPEAIIYGYAKALCMDEAALKGLIPNEQQDDLESARSWFKENNLDLAFIKSGFSIYLGYRDKEDDFDAKLSEYLAFVNSDKDVTSKAILEKAFALAGPDFMDEFKSGKGISDLFAGIPAKKTEEKEESGDIEKEEKKEKKSDDDELTDEDFIALSKGFMDPDDDLAAKRTASKKNESLSELSLKYSKLSEALLDVVKGQDSAVLKFIQGYNQGELLKNAEKNKGPRSYFFFLGPPGVGKTLLAETAAENLGIPYRVFNMSEYSGPQANEELIGTPRIYNNAKEGVLTDYVTENPECLLVFDEIEKAHLNVIRLFLQILGAGKLHSMYADEDVDFSGVTIIFTSNVGKALYADDSVNLTTLPASVIIDAIKSETKPNGDPAMPVEIVSRLASGNIIMFNHLSIRHLVELIGKSFAKVSTAMKEKFGIDLTLPKYLPLLFLYSRGAAMDARVAIGQSGKFIKDEIFELIRQISGEKKDISSVDFDIDWDSMDKDLNQLFKNQEKSRILVFAGEDTVSLLQGMNTAEILSASGTKEAKQLLKGEIDAVFIDPFFGKNSDSELVLSISDYNTEGIRFFHEIADASPEMPLYLLETEKSFSNVDLLTFTQEGAYGFAKVDKENPEEFRKEISSITEELYMQSKSESFSSQGWVIGFNTRQTFKDGRATILFYDLKKRKAIDSESRGSILSDAERPNIHFSDVIGAENAKDELKYFVKYLTNPKSFLASGAKPPKGVLLYGPPGTGKTMLAKAMAGESDVTFLETSASEFKNKYVGESEANIRAIFAKAKKYAPSIIFIDEIDAIGKKRRGGDDTVTESMLNALLTEMDGFSSQDTKKPVFVLAATNYGVGEDSDGIAALDPALIRRFDNKIYVALPNESERKQYIELMLRKKKITTVTENTIRNVAERTTGQSLAILQNVIDLAYRNAVKKSQDVTDAMLLTALEEYTYGKKKEHSKEYYERVAIHETGHAVVAYLSGDKPSYITIESRGNFGGYMQHANAEEATGYTKDELLSHIRTALAGRAAEEVFYGKKAALNTGASDDLRQATDIAFAILATYGMDEDSLLVLSRQDILNSALASEYTGKVNAILKEEMKETISIISEHKEQIRKIADVLVRENKLTGADFEKLMEE